MIRRLVVCRKAWLGKLSKDQGIDTTGDMDEEWTKWLEKDNLNRHSKVSGRTIAQ